MESQGGCYLGLDIGTTATKAVLIDGKGEVLAKATGDHTLNTPKPKWAEQDPEEWVQACITAIKEILKTRNAAEIKSVSFSGQMHGLVLLDQHYKVLRAAILWCDTRTSDQCREIEAKVGIEGLASTVSNAALEGFTAPKILWVREHEPQIYSKVRHLCLPKDYVRFRMTGQLYQEISDAAGMLLLDVAHRQWSELVIEKLDIQKSHLPELKQSWEVSGKVTKEFAGKCGLLEGTVCIAGGADNACSAVGNGIVEEGKVLASLGTSGVVLAAASSALVDPSLRAHCFCHSAPGKWYNMGVILSAGGAYHWLSQTLHLDFQTMNKEASTVRPGSEGALFLPYLCGERTPHADSNARGTFFGLALKHTRANMIRACMQGVSFAMRDALEVVKQMGVKVSEVLITGGGAQSQEWQQMLADIFGCPVKTVKSREGPGYGAALLAAVGVGHWSSVEAAIKQCFADHDEAKQVVPIEENVKTYEGVYQLYKKLYLDLKDSFKQLNSLNL